MSDLIYRHTGRDYYYRTWHKIEKSMLLLVHEGNGSIVTKEKSYPMKRGTLCFIGTDKYHYTFPDRTEDYVRSKLFVPTEQLRMLLRPLSSAFSKAFLEQGFCIGGLNDADTQSAEQIFAQLTQISPDSELFGAQTYSAFLQLAILLVQNSDVTPQSNLGTIPTAIEYVNEHVTEELTVERICAAVYMSKYHFCRLFKEKTGLTVMDYVLKTRLMMAKELLTQGERSVTQISHDCGFCSPSYFSRIFKEKVGQSPSKYQKINSQQKAIPFE